MEFRGNQDLTQNQLKNVVVDTGTVFPATPIVGQLFFRSDTSPKMLYIFLGIGVPGTSAGWMNLCHAYYA